MEIIYAKIQACATVLLDGAVYFIIAMLGAFAKDLYDTCTGGRPRIEIYRIFVATTLSTFLTFAARDYVNSENLLPLINFVLGIIGWELFIRISTIDGLVGTITSARQLISSLINPTNIKNVKDAANTAKEVVDAVEEVKEELDKAKK